MSFQHLVVFLLFSVAIVSCYEVQQEVSCPPPGRYPKYLLDGQLQGPKYYQGTFQADGYIKAGGQIVANLSGLALQEYDKKLQTYVGYFFLKVEDGYMQLVNYTFTLLPGSGRFCLNFLPEGIVPQYVEGRSYSDTYFENIYYSKDKKNLGEIVSSEFFIGEKGGLSTNVVSAFAGGLVASETHYVFTKISNKALFPQNIGHGRVARANQYNQF
ncbi:Hypothetical protein BRZCDTV_70 [Brazilian cedratvirus IHUMI]|uniref:Uncharacterized protein n=1 Tax=Brazilian cedratvirus IHUMI TaxID=2126980 RepID=A0A2R8FD42_9VIRU|nr:Hypothetical protein BRZCDTV_70 [Brazilian cedratvirus IHUMI]